MPRGERRWRLVAARREPVPGLARPSRSRRPARLGGASRHPTRGSTARAARRPRRTGRWLAGALVVVLVAGLAWVVFATSLLGVREVRVTGSVIAPPEQVRAVAAVTLGTPLVRVDLGAVRARVRAIPSVADAAVHRAWPSTLVIDVSERRAVAAVPVGEGFALVDAQAVVLQRVAQRPAGLALVRVATPGPQDASTRAALTVLAALTPQLRAALAAVVADSPDRIRLELAGGRTVTWGDATQSETKARVATALLGQPGRTIDVSAPDVATVG
jgi:cell division protein FtsQ